MATTFSQRAFIQSLNQFIGEEVLLRGWVSRLRVLAKTTFVILRDCSGEAQCVAASDLLRDLRLKLDDTVELYGRVRADERAKAGYEIEILRAQALSRAANNLPFNSSSNIDSVGQETLLEYRPLAARNDAVGNVFRVQAALLRYFREDLTTQRFTEIISITYLKSQPSQLRLSAEEWRIENGKWRMLPHQ
jgi:nondiscriminating aspartyl-tRNA synthetase